MFVNATTVEISAHLRCANLTVDLKLRLELRFNGQSKRGLVCLLRRIHGTAESHQRCCTATNNQRGYP